ncbi:ATP synthase F0 subunit 6 (mitochondrion) [Teleogryllus occipitalis]|uniref:ATP synthase subunit a n=1 Tax=Teleogryllus occipitalis TaxID=470939 RepID=A0A679FKV7_9ORTH|nr:ATP synthase F0 subunit 6 [Teleogryllus occipitalis]BBV28439.1 ATP synthase F0 subunit 6 [Teleogryllus occipitalis]
MMTNLFSSFDPTSNIFNIPMNWLSTLLGMLILPSSYWLIPNRSSLMWNLLINKLYNEFKTLLVGNKNMGSSFMFISLFSIILFNNFLGLFPYIFTSSSHLTFTLSLALPFWLSFMLYGWINNTQHMFAHLVPQGTPPILMPFMVCIETISNIIRPLTLAVRLAANMIAGHLLLTLLGNTGPMIMNSTILIQILILSQILLLILELAVSIIQSYVFAVLTTLYSSEVN